MGKEKRVCPRRHTPPVSAVVDGLDRRWQTYGRGSTVAAVEEAVEGPMFITARRSRGTRSKWERGGRLGDVSRCDEDLFSKGLHFVTPSSEGEPRRATVPTSKENPGGVAEQPSRALLLPLDHDLAFTLFKSSQVKEICIQNQEYNHTTLNI